MKSRYSQVLPLVCALLAFLPILAVDFTLDSYVRQHELAKLQDTVDNITASINRSADGASAALRRVIATSPSLCTPTFRANAVKAITGSLYLKEILVENDDGVQYCDAFESDVAYVRLSSPLSISGRPETVSVVTLGELRTPALKLTQTVGLNRQISAFTPVLLQPSTISGLNLRPGSAVRISLTNGTTVLSEGDQRLLRDNGSDTTIVVDAFAGGLPLKAELGTPFAIARAEYADLDLMLTVVACILSATLLVVTLQFSRRANGATFDLEHAIGRGQLRAYYQPVINLMTGKVAGCEVLVRWEKRNGEIVPPGAFIEHAEHSGLAIPMTLKLMQQAKADLGQLCRDIPDFKISINLFEGHFRDSTIVDDVQAIFAEGPINYRQLVFELTERRPIVNSLQAKSVIAGLHALGCRLAMDDAGTGHSNLEYLQTLGVDIIKLDRVFVAMVKPETTQVPVLDGLIAMGHDLNIQIIAEGVETPDQARYLRSRGVTMAQGFLFAPALKTKAFRDLAHGLNLALDGKANAARPAAATVA